MSAGSFTAAASFEEGHPSWEYRPPSSRRPACGRQSRLLGWVRITCAAGRLRMPTTVDNIQQISVRYTRRNPALTTHSAMDDILKSCDGERSPLFSRFQDSRRICGDGSGLRSLSVPDGSSRIAASRQAGAPGEPRAGNTCAAGGAGRGSRQEAGAGRPGMARCDRRRGHSSSTHCRTAESSGKRPARHQLR